MLPERISNDLCSLREGQDRPALAARIVINAEGRKRSHTFHRVLMRSAAKLHYGQVQAAIDGWPDTMTGPLLAGVLEPLYAAYRALKRARDERGPLELDLPERKIVLTAHNTVDRVFTPERVDAHRLIEEFMIAANVSAAETLERAGVALIYRVHDVEQNDVTLAALADRERLVTVARGDNVEIFRSKPRLQKAKVRRHIIDHEYPGAHVLCLKQFRENA